MALHHDIHFPVATDEVPWVLGQGAIAGVIAGLSFAVYGLLASAAMEAGGFFTPLRMIGAILLGRDALDPGYPLLVAGAAGVSVHLVLSVAYGMIFSLLAAGLRSPMWDITLGSAFGLSLWLINFYVVAPIAFPWFLELNPIVQFIGHTFFFGTLLGVCIWRSRAWGHAGERA